MCSFKNVCLLISPPYLNDVTVNSQQYKYQTCLVCFREVFFRNPKSDFLSSEGAFFVKKVIKYGNTKLCGESAQKRLRLFTVFDFSLLTY